VLCVYNIQRKLNCCIIFFYFKLFIDLGGDRKASRKCLKIIQINTSRPNLSYIKFNKKDIVNKTVDPKLINVEHVAHVDIKI